MPEGRFKSRSFKRIMKKLPGGSTIMQHERRKPAKAVCSVCGIILKGVPRDLPAQISKLSKTQRRPERPFGGVMCGGCLKQKIKNESRV